MQVGGVGYSQHTLTIWTDARLSQWTNARQANLLATKILPWSSRRCKTGLRCSWPCHGRAALDHVPLYTFSQSDIRGV